MRWSLLGLLTAPKDLLGIFKLRGKEKKKKGEKTKY